MARIVIIGNSGGGKSTLARKLSAGCDLPHVEIDRLLWREDWSQTPADVYEREHAAAVAGDRWIMDGWGRHVSAAARIGRATEIILIDMPIWMHFWLAAERQIAWSRGEFEHPPAGVAQPPPTRALFETMWDIERNWMPALRELCDRAEAEGKRVVRIASIEELDRFAAAI
ncbi:adenylate kinase [Terrarubrum flagellatum]|uniref:adenylate kinase n=1 Tax=Terrirubrum flagellatum TaxID=2895980 RepID=UPI003144E6C3